MENLKHDIIFFDKRLAPIYLQNIKIYNDNKNFINKYHRIIYDLNYVVFKKLLRILKVNYSFVHSWDEFIIIVANYEFHYFKFGLRFGEKYNFIGNEINSINNIIKDRLHRNLSILL